MNVILFDTRVSAALADVFWRIRRPVTYLSLINSTIFKI